MGIALADMRLGSNRCINREFTITSARSAALAGPSIVREICLQ
jgi:hypothetical protein